MLFNDINITNNFLDNGRSEDGSAIYFFKFVDYLLFLDILYIIWATIIILITASILYKFQNNSNIIYFNLSKFLLLLCLVIIFSIILIINSISWMDNYTTIYLFYFFIKKNLINLYVILFILFLFFFYIIYIYVNISLNKYFQQKIDHFYIYILIVIGCILLLSINDFLLFFIVFELISLGIYVIIALNLKSSLAVESSLKYYIIGTISSIFMLLSISLIYGISGITNFNDLYNFLFFIDFEKSILGKYILVAIFLFLVSIFFKLGLFPFHFWLPTIYENISYKTLLFIFIIPKTTYIFVCLFLLYNTFFFCIEYLINYIYIFAILSIFIGSFCAIYQKNIKRLLSFSSINNIGYILLIIILYSSNSNINLIFYTFFYILNLFLFFFLIQFIKKLNNYNEIYIQNINEFSNLFKINSKISIIFAFIVFSIAGLPPFLGFYPKYMLLIDIFNNKLTIYGLCILIVTLISTYYYIKLIKIVFFEKNLKNNKYFFLFNNSIYLNFLQKKNNFIFFLISSNFILNIFFMLYPFIIYYMFYFILYTEYNENIINNNIINNISNKNNNIERNYLDILNAFGKNKNIIDNENDSNNNTQKSCNECCFFFDFEEKVEKYKLKTPSEMYLYHSVGERMEPYIEAANKRNYLHNLFNFCNNLILLESKLNQIYSYRECNMNVPVPNLYTRPIEEYDPKVLEFYERTDVSAIDFIINSAISEFHELLDFRVTNLNDQCLNEYFSVRFDPFLNKKYGELGMRKLCRLYYFFEQNRVIFNSPDLYTTVDRTINYLTKIAEENNFKMNRIAQREENLLLLHDEILYDMGKELTFIKNLEDNIKWFYRLKYHFSHFIEYDFDKAKPMLLEEDYLEPNFGTPPYDIEVVIFYDSTKSLRLMREEPEELMPGNVYNSLNVDQEEYLKATNELIFNVNTFKWNFIDYSRNLVNYVNNSEEAEFVLQKYKLLKMGDKSDIKRTIELKVRVYKFVTDKYHPLYYKSLNIYKTNDINKIPLIYHGPYDQETIFEPDRYYNFKGEFRYSMFMLEALRFVKQGPKIMGTTPYVEKGKYCVVFATTISKQREVMKLYRELNNIVTCTPDSYDEICSGCTDYVDDENGVPTCYISEKPLDEFDNTKEDYEPGSDFDGSTCNLCVTRLETVY